MDLQGRGGESMQLGLCQHRDVLATPRLLEAKGGERVVGHKPISPGMVEHVADDGASVLALSPSPLSRAETIDASERDTGEGAGEQPYGVVVGRASGPLEVTAVVLHPAHGEPVARLLGDAPLLLRAHLQLGDALGITSRPPSLERADPPLPSAGAGPTAGLTNRAHSGRPC